MRSQCEDITLAKLETKMTPDIVPGTEVRLTLLQAQGFCFPARIDNVSGVQLHICLSSALPFGAPVQLESDNLLLLGDVTHCEPVEQGFVAGVTVRHALTMLSSLRKLNESLDHEATTRSLRNLNHSLDYEESTVRTSTPASEFAQTVR